MILPNSGVAKKNWWLLYYIDIPFFGLVSPMIYDKRDDLNFEIVNFPFLDGDVPCSPAYGVYISQLISFARVCSNRDDFNNRTFF